MASREKSHMKNAVGEGHLPDNECHKSDGISAALENGSLVTYWLKQVRKFNFVFFNTNAHKHFLSTSPVP
jgi:hypothetical protein